MADIKKDHSVGSAAGATAGGADGADVDVAGAVQLHAGGLELQALDVGHAAERHLRGELAG